MSDMSKEAVFSDILGILNKLSEDWEYGEEITPETFFIGDLGFESIDLVVLATTIEKKYQKGPIPQEVVDKLNEKYDNHRTPETVARKLINLYIDNKANTVEKLYKKLEEKNPSYKENMEELDKNLKALNEVYDRLK